MRSTKGQLRNRLEEVLAMRLSGAEFWDIRKHADEQGWDKSNTQLRRYIAHSDRLLAATLEKDRTKLLNRHIAARRGLFARAMSVADYATARQILRDEAELLGLYPAKETRLTGKDGGPIQVAEALTDEQLAAIALTGAPSDTQV